MKGLKEAIGRRTNSVAHDFSVLPATGKAQRVVQRLIGEVQVREPDPIEVDQLLATVQRVWASGSGLSSLTSRQQRDLPWIVFYPPDGSPGDWLGANPAFARALLANVESQLRSSTVSKLMAVWLRRFPVNLPTFDLWANGIEQLLARAHKPRLNKWRERSEQMPIFARAGPNGLAGRLIGSDAPVDDVLCGWGLEGVLGTGDFVRLAGHEIARATRDRLSSNKDGERHVDRLKEFVLLRTGAKRFADLKRPTVESVLEPFVSQMPEPDLQARVMSLVLSLAKDPRIVPSSWQGISEEARTVMLRWLVADTLDQFFAIVGRTAKVDRHWTDREQFWRAYLDAGAISDAWVVLGRDAEELAKRILEKEMLGAGRLEGRGDPTHSVLILRIDSLTIAEWSHNGRCRFFLESNVEAPKPYKPSYSAQNIKRMADYSIVHHKGVWRGKAASYIRWHTGIAV